MYTWKQWKFFLLMMERRGFDVDLEKSMKEDAWRVRFHVTEDRYIDPFVFCDHYEGGKLIMVFFLPATTIVLSHITMFINRIKEENINHGIVIHLNKWTCYAKDALNMDNSLHYFEKIDGSFFNFDPMTHIWQPEFLMLTIAEGKKLCEALCIKPHQFPILKKDGVVSTYWGWQKKRGRIIKIISSDSITSEKNISYRILE